MTNLSDAFCTSHRQQKRMQRRVRSTFQLFWIHARRFFIKWVVCRDFPYEYEMVCAGTIGFSQENQSLEQKLSRRCIHQQNNVSQGGNWRETKEKEMLKSYQKTHQLMKQQLS